MTVAVDTVSRAVQNLGRPRSDAREICEKMRKGSFALTAITGLVSFSTVALAADPPRGKAPAAAPDAGVSEAKRAEPPAPTAKPAPGAAPAKPAAAPATKRAAAPDKAPAPSDKQAAPAETPSEADEDTTAAAPAGGGADATHPTDSALPEPSQAPARPPTPARAGTGFGPIGLFPAQGPSVSPSATPPPPVERKSTDGVLAEDWWSHARPVFELHGYFRTRAELFHNFSLGRIDPANFAIWPQPADNYYVAAPSQQPVGSSKLCTPSEAGYGGTDSPTTLVPCRNKTQAGANLRFRLDPELHVSDNLRVLSQIDILDDVVLGSNPSNYGFSPAASGGGYAVNQRGGYGSISALDDTTVAPQSGVNSLSSSIAVKRVWAEYTTPVGELRFGRMPDHFGLGMVHNSGDAYDDDYQSTIDRLQFITAIKPLDLYIGGSWDFPNEGPLRQPTIAGGQAYDAAQLDDVNQWSLLLMRKESPELVNNSLSHGKLVLNGGAYVTLRKQLLANDLSGNNGTAGAGANVPNATPSQQATGYSRRDAIIWVPDVWLQLRYKKFRFEAEWAGVLGSFENTDPSPTAANFTSDAAARKIREFGVATQLEQRLVEDKLRLGFDFGWASGDSSAFNADSTNNLVPQPGVNAQNPATGDTISTFRFHPAYRVDLILHRYLLGRVEGTYYFKPSVEYDFMRKQSGQRLGGGAGVIWTRASEFVQTPGHANDLGLELNGRLYFQSKDGSLNDKPGRMGGFYAMLEYGVLFPLAGLGYQPVEKSRNGGADTSAAQILRLFLGVMF
jgi:uncharacterized protein (TIGR04551 family)